MGWLMKFSTIINSKKIYSIVRSIDKIKDKLSLELPQMYFINPTETERESLLWLKAKIETAVVNGENR